MKKLVLLAVLILAGLAVSVRADDVLVRLFGSDFIVPLRIVNGTELYSFKEGRGFPAIESVLWTKGTLQAGAGAAAVIGSDVNVPFAFIQKRLSSNFFETGNNDLRFGVWAGKPSRRIGEEKAKWLFGIKASTQLW